VKVPVYELRGRDPSITTVPAGSEWGPTPGAADAFQAAIAGGEALLRGTLRLIRRRRAPRDDAAELEVLVYELLDAHADTSQLAERLQRDREWAAHLDYLRALQRRGREALAHATLEEPR
jgi:hypothetical protein